MSAIHDKRQSNNYQTGYEIRQKLRTNTVLESKYRERKSIICIENFPNELFYEIFDYLDGYEIYQSFSNLNLRFQHLLSSSILPLKINLSPFLDTNIQQDCLEIISKQKSHIISLCLMYTLNIDRFFTLISFDSSFLRLESLIVVGLKSDDLFKYLSILTLLPRLTSFILCVSYNLKDFHHIYKLIFNLSVLKYIKFSSEAYEPIIPLTIANKNQFSSIEYLIINHSCNIYDLISILSYTPRLNRLICRELIKSTENIIQEPMIINLSNLTYMG